MRPNPHFELESVSEIKRLIRRNSWATIVANTTNGMVASHYPVLLDEPEVTNDKNAHDVDASDEIVLVTHVGRPDEKILELDSAQELLVIIQGPHGYISPSWYDDESFVPTWNFVTAHLWGVPEILSEEENLAVLDRLVNTFEKHVDDPRSLDTNPDLAKRTAKGTVGIRVKVTRFEAKSKLNQNKSPEVIANVISQLRADGPYKNPALAAEMERVNKGVL